jgi:hypothetical protein
LVNYLPFFKSVSRYAFLLPFFLDFFFFLHFFQLYRLCRRKRRIYDSKSQVNQEKCTNQYNSAKINPRIAKSLSKHYLNIRPTFKCHTLKHNKKRKGKVVKVCDTIVGVVVLFTTEIIFRGTFLLATTNVGRPCWIVVINLTSVYIDAPIFQNTTKQLSSSNGKHNEKAHKYK